jgi:hypothetical protein
VETTGERSIAGWNATDQAERRALIDQARTADGSYIDPVMQGTESTEIDATLAGVQQRFPRHEMRLAGRRAPRPRAVRLGPFRPGRGGALDRRGRFRHGGRGRTAEHHGFIDAMPGL